MGPLKGPKIGVTWELWKRKWKLLHIGLYGDPILVYPILGLYGNNGKENGNDQGIHSLSKALSHELSASTGSVNCEVRAANAVGSGSLAISLLQSTGCRV